LADEDELVAVDADDEPALLFEPQAAARRATAPMLLKQRIRRLAARLPLLLLRLTFAIAPTLLMSWPGPSTMRYYVTQRRLVQKCQWIVSHADSRHESAAPEADDGRVRA
jgi:hypothetical protein